MAHSVGSNSHGDDGVYDLNSRVSFGDLGSNVHNSIGERGSNCHVSTGDRGSNVGGESGTRLLRCNFQENVFVIAVPINLSFNALVELVMKNVNGLHGLKFSLIYRLREGPKCVLRNDEDVGLMFYSQRMVRCDFVDVVVELVIPQGGGNVVGDELVMPEQNEDFGSFNIAVRRPSRVLLSREWRDYIVCVDHKFEECAEDFREKLVKYAAKMGFEFEYKKNDKERITDVCTRKILEGCKWCVHASMSLSNGAFYIRTLNNIHTCSGCVRKKNSAMLTSKIVSTLIIDKVRANLQFGPRDIIDYVWESYGFQVNYWNAWYAKEIARKEVVSDDSLSYNHLARYLNLVRESNPGSYCVLDVDEATRRFKRVFISFGAYIRGFRFCRPLLCLDGTFLKNKYKGTLLIAAEKNGNQGLYHFALAVVGSETQDNWSWFTEHLAVILPDRGRGITFMTDRNPGLLNAVRDTFPDSPYGHCIHYMKANLQSRFSGTFNVKKRATAVKLFLRCDYGPTEDVFNTNFNELMALNMEKIVGFLRGSYFENWANAFFVGNRYGNMCSNIAESFNSWILKERFLPTTEMVDAIRVKMMRMIADRYDASSKWTSILCPVMEEKLVERAQLGRHFGVVKANDAEYEVDDRGRFTVNVVEGTCSCQMWRINSFPCAHAVAVSDV